MFKQPVFIAAVISLLACIPLYFLATQEFQLNTGNLPLIALSLFVIILIATYWSNATAHYHEPDPDENRSHAPRESGNVKWFNANKGFGFITRDSGEDVFVHFRSIRGNGHRVLHDGERVEFAESEGDKGPQAEDVAVAR